MTETRKDVWGFFWCAIEDIEASKILFESEHFPYTAFYLQQASEKLVKSFSILGYITG